ncbi:hypothetical protein CEUSTIGMA_g10839.t1 [Chlamydomonas eustigma]|uniref:Serine/threonine-protein phosphatase 1 regulatory subunit 10 n=1 Tax=Chlamydomonas eustigma TaxID=1157962 RepID=A0A250XK16_9CHLO|nr:hypothetical protein CEUSTIGMA_g10839.t1 [Chlamydomonas eustigma]|eukprot:GAX83414.1 hypothetical protein CEUSTIGMA_g10839.t1 [Chlamydomonas eustigma]
MRQEFEELLPETQGITAIPEGNAFENSFMQVDAPSDLFEGQIIFQATSSQGHQEAVPALQRILNPGGGVTDEKHWPTLESLLEREQGMGMFSVLLLVVERSSKEIKHKALQGNLLKCVEMWTNQVLERGPQMDSDSASLLQAILRCLSAMPMDLHTLKRTGIGRVVGSLRKQQDISIAATAKQLVEQWRRLADSGAPESGIGDKKRAEASTIDGTEASSSAASKKARTELKVMVLVSADARQAPDSIKTSTSIVVPSPVSGVPAVAGKTSPKAVASKLFTPAAAASNQGLLQIMDADDMLREVTAPNPTHTNATSSGGIRNAVPTARKAQTLQRLGIDEALGTSVKHVRPSTHVASNGDLEAKTPSDVDGIAAAGFDQVVSPQSTVGTSGTGLAAPRPRLGTLAGSFGAGAAAVGRLGSLRDGPGATGLRSSAPQPQGLASVSASMARTATVFSPSPPPVTAANQKAANARSRIPSPEPSPKRQKLKSVSWVSDEKLVSLRWFKKEDPSIAAKSDSLYTDEELEKQAHPAGSRSISLPQQGPSSSTSTPGSVGGTGGVVGFENVARREHAFERSAITALQLQEKAEKKEMLDRLRAMAPQVRWPASVPGFFSDPEWNVAVGEESGERHSQSERAYRLPPVSYPTPSHVPPSPSEPNQLEAEPPRSQPVLSIPLSVMPTVPTVSWEGNNNASLQQQQQLEAGGDVPQGLAVTYEQVHSVQQPASSAMGSAPSGATQSLGIQQQQQPPALMVATQGSAPMAVDISSLLASLAPALASVPAPAPAPAPAPQQQQQQVLQPDMQQVLALLLGQGMQQQLQQAGIVIQDQAAGPQAQQQQLGPELVVLQRPSEVYNGAPPPPPHRGAAGPAPGQWAGGMDFHTAGGQRRMMPPRGERPHWDSGWKEEGLMGPGPPVHVGRGVGMMGGPMHGQPPPPPHLHHGGRMGPGMRVGGPPPPPPGMLTAGRGSGMMRTMRADDGQHESRVGGGDDYQPSAVGTKVCAFFNLPVGCRHGDGCRFQHVKVSSEEVHAILASMPGAGTREGAGRGRGRR